MPNDESATDALQRDIDIPGHSSLSLDIDLSKEAIENSYGIDISATVPENYSPPEYINNPRFGSFDRLHISQREELRDHLNTKHDSNSVQNILWLLEEWKQSSNPKRIGPRALEFLYVEAFGLSTEIRTPDSRGPIRCELTKGEIDSIIDYRRASLSCLKQHHGLVLNVFRGSRKSVAGQLFMQALDSPERDSFIIEGTTAINVTTINSVAWDFANGVVLDFHIPLSDVLCAADQVRIGDKPCSNELHMIGGPLVLQKESVLHADGNSGVYHPLTRTVRQIRTGNISDVALHDAVFNLLRVANRKSIQVGTDVGRRILEKWLEIVKQERVYSRAKRRKVRKYVNAVGTPNSTDAYWIE